MTRPSPSTATKLTDALLALAERCEAATGSDRELDAQLHCVREELEFVLLSKGGEIYGEICDPSDSGYGGRNTCTPGLLYARYPDHKNPPTLGGGKRGNKVQGCTADNFTASLDAAMTLVPSNMEDRGYYFALEQECLLPSSAGWSARFDPSGDECGHANTILASANTPALATCAAALRARAAQ